MPRVHLMILLLSVSTFFMLGSCKKIKERREGTTEIRKGTYFLVNPLLDCYDLEESTLAAMMRLERDIEKYIEESIENNAILHCSVYYRDLNNGPWIGIKEDEKYAPASLLKVPMLIAALKQAEEDPSFLSKTITYVPRQNELVQNIVENSFRLIVGKEYTIDQLLNFMIIYSDNTSKDILLDHLLLTNFNSIFHDLGIDIAKYGTEDNFLSVKEYATYFRMLYNATYLSKEMSNKALEILTKTTFKSGISQGVPENIIVAHKFGERTFANNSTIQLHESGIVYKENSPYLICIMVKGSSFQSNAKVIEDISKIVYNAAGK
jgi:beta-lactamase class A